jgi:hypothetical protein
MRSVILSSLFVSALTLTAAQDPQGAPGMPMENAPEGYDAAPEGYYPQQEESDGPGGDYAPESTEGDVNAAQFGFGRGIGWGGGIGWGTLAHSLLPNRWQKMVGWWNWRMGIFSSNCLIFQGGCGLGGWGGYGGCGGFGTFQ